METKGGISAARGKMLIAMALFGSIGMFVRFIDLPSGLIALVRGAVGVAFLALAVCLGRKPFSFAAVRKRLGILALSGAFIGFNWILLFEAYRYTTVAIATLCYYLAPAFVILVAPFVIKERLTWRKALGALIAILGMSIASGVWSGSGVSVPDVRGILLGVGAAMLYAAVQLLNRFLDGVGAYEKTIAQLFFAALVMLPYTLFFEPLHGLAPAPFALVMLVTVGIVHTGVAYALYFSAVNGLPASTVAMLGYVDPVLAIALSVLVLQEPLGWDGGLGALLVLGALFVSERTGRKR